MVDQAGEEGCMRDEYPKQSNPIPDHFWSRIIGCCHGEILCMSPRHVLCMMSQECLHACVDRWVCCERS